MLVDLSELAKSIGLEPQEVVLPNGSTVSRLVWSGEHLVDLDRIFHNQVDKMENPIDINGPAPAWLVAGLAHIFHPRYVRLNSPDGYVPLGMGRPQGEGSEENIKFSVDKSDVSDWLIITCMMKDPSVPLDPDKLGEMIPPEVLMGSKIIISGRIPNWLTASLAMAYHGVAKAVACYQPGIGATVSWTHSKGVRLGEVVQ